MLSAFSKFAKSIWGKAFAAFLVIGMVAFGVTNVVTGLGINTIAEAGGQEMNVRDFDRSYRDYVNLMARQIGRVPTTEEAQALGIPAVVLQQFRTDSAFSRMATEMGIGVTDRRLGELLQQDPTFGAAFGSSDRNRFKEALRQVGYTENEYLERIANMARREQLETALFDDAPVPAVARNLISRFSGDRRSVDYFVLNAASLPPVADPTEEELAAYLAEHQATFRTVETRNVDLVALSVEALAAARQPTEEEIAAEYERTRASRVIAEKRTVRQVVLTSPEQEAAFTEGLAAGRSFDELVAETGVTPSDLGNLTRNQITDNALAEAAFSLPDTGFAVIEGIGGNKRVVAVTAIEAGGEVALEDVRDDISRQLANTAARAEYNDILDQIEELRAAFRTLPEIAERFGLTLHQLPLTASGAELSVLSDLPATERPRVTTRIFSTEQGDLSPTISLGSNYNVWFDLKSVEPARDQTLDEVRDAVVAAWTSEQEAAAVSAEVATILASLEEGIGFADAAVAANQFPQLTQPIGRSGDGGSIDAAVATEIFNGGEGHVGSAVNAQGDHVVFHVVEVIPPAEDAAETLAAIDFVERGTRDAIHASFVGGLVETVGLRVNQQALAQYLGTDAAAQ